MSNILKLDFRRLGLKRSPATGVLALTLDGSRLDGVVMRRTNGSVELIQSFSVVLSLDPLTAPPELVGRELRNHLDVAGVREKRCVFGIPLKWALTAHTIIPELPEEDVENFLQVEMERGFPCDLASLVLATSRYTSPSGQQHATFIGMPRNHIATLYNVLLAAQLKPVSFSLGLAALQPPASRSPEGVLAMAIGQTSIALQISASGGLVALRALEGTLEDESGQPKLRSEVIAREMRITLAQMAPDLRDTIRRVRIFGPPDLAQQLADEIDMRLEVMRLDTEVVTGYNSSEYPFTLPVHAPVSTSFSLAARFLAGQINLEFLPPRVSSFQQFTSRYSSGRLQRAGVLAGVVAALVGGAFLVQQFMLWNLQTKWGGMKKNVSQVQTVQARILQFRPWCDDTMRSLTILRRLTESFPEDGSVTAKTLEIRDLNTVTCTGVARDYQALLKTVERLRALPQVQNEVSLGQTRGQSPTLQFSFSFVWRDGGQHAN